MSRLERHSKAVEEGEGIDTLTTELSDANAEIAETKTQMKRAGEDREAENADFQQTVPPVGRGSSFGAQRGQHVNNRPLRACAPLGRLLTSARRSRFSPSPSIG